MMVGGEGGNREGGNKEGVDTWWNIVSQIHRYFPFFPFSP